MTRKAPVARNNRGPTYIFMSSVIESHSYYESDMLNCTRQRSMFVDQDQRIDMK